MLKVSRSGQRDGQVGDEPLGAASPERAQVDAAGGLVLAQQQRGDEESGQGEEHTVTPRCPPTAQPTPAWNSSTATAASPRTPSRAGVRGSRVMPYAFPPGFRDNLAC